MSLSECSALMAELTVWATCALPIADTEVGHLDDSMWAVEAADVAAVVGVAGTNTEDGVLLL